MDDGFCFIILLMKLTVIIPVYNEEKTIEEIIQRVQNTRLADDIIIIDDGSTDGTRDRLKSLVGFPGLRILYHEKNLGKGAAIKTGISASRGDILLIQDADLEYDPREYPNLLRPIEEGIADVVYGSRFLGAARRPILFWNMLANKILTLVTNILYNNILSDMETGYKVFRKQIVEGIKIRARGFDFEPEFTAKVLKNRARIFEVPIIFNPRDYSEGKKIKMKDAFIAFWTLIKFRFVN
jgi:glycosyltransferase involved in cell wall biosynthesis